MVGLVAAQYGVTNEEAARRVTRMESDIKTSQAQSEQRTSAAADEAARATAARELFPALILGLLGALVGSWIATRHKRVLHPAVHQAYPVQHDLGHLPGVASERSEPSSMSVHEDHDNLMYQYLRGISFPVSKQELLRLARSSGKAGMLHSMEDMPKAVMQMLTRFSGRSVAWCTENSFKTSKFGPVVGNNLAAVKLRWRSLRSRGSRGDASALHGGTYSGSMAQSQGRPQWIARTVTLMRSIVSAIDSKEKFQTKMARSKVRQVGRC